MNINYFTECFLTQNLSSNLRLILTYSHQFLFNILKFVSDNSIFFANNRLEKEGFFVSDYFLHWQKIPT